MRSPLFLVLLFILILFQINCLSAQEAAPAGPSGGPVLRFGFYEMLHQTYWTEEDNTFYQMTGTNRFRGGKGYQGIPSGDITDIQIPDGISANVNTKNQLMETNIQRLTVHSEGSPIGFRAFPWNILFPRITWSEQDWDFITPTPGWMIPVFVRQRPDRTRPTTHR